MISMLGYRATGAAGLICALLTAAVAAPETRAPNDVPVASDVRLAGDETKTRLIVDFDRKIEVRAFALANPGYVLGERVVAELAQLFPEDGCCSL